MLDKPEFVEARRDQLPGTVSVAWDHARGPLDAAIVLVFYGAYLCPRARRLWAVVQDAAERFRSPLRVVCRQLPGRSASSLAAALLSERAETVRFWEVHERMMSSADVDERNALAGVDRWHHTGGAAFGVGALAPWDRIGEHARIARVLGVGEGPALFLNGRRYTGPAERTALLAALESLLKERSSREPGAGGLDRASGILSLVSHELRAALTPLVLALHPAAGPLLEAGLPDDVVNRLSIARRQACVLARHLAHLADTYDGRISFFQPQPVSGDLVQIVRAVVASASLTAARSTIPLRIEADREILGSWDALRIEQMVGNLVSNAIKYGGAKPIMVVAKKIGPFARLAVRDQGAGMSPDELALLFTPHARLERHRQSPGIGLGLYIVRSLAEAHGGRVFVVSERGCGSTFGVDLPLASGESATAHGSETFKQAFAEAPARTLAATESFWHSSEATTWWSSSTTNGDA